MNHLSSVSEAQSNCPEDGNPSPGSKSPPANNLNYENMRQHNFPAPHYATSTAFPNAMTSSSYAQSQAEHWILADNINYNMEFMDGKVQEEFFNFRTASTPPIFSVGVAVFIFVGYVIYWVLVFRDYFAPFPVIIAVLSFIIAIPLFWILIYLRYMSLEQQSKQRMLLILLESAVSLGMQITLGMIFVMRTLRRCESLTFLDRWSCNVGYDTYDIPSDVSFVLICIPLIFSVIFPYLPFVVIYVCEATGITFVIAMISYRQAYGSAVFVAVLIIFSLFLLFVYRLQQMQLFLFTTKYYNAVRTQERRERHIASHLTNEMRSLISSVSHDLKSVRKVH
jgi:fatty acid desaturase